MMDIWDLPEETRNIDQQALGYQLVTGDSNTKNLWLLDVLQISTTPLSQMFECFLWQYI